MDATYPTPIPVGERLPEVNREGGCDSSCPVMVFYSCTSKIDPSFELGEWRTAYLVEEDGEFLWQVDLDDYVVDFLEPLGKVSHWIPLPPRPFIAPPSMAEIAGE